MYCACASAHVQRRCTAAEVSVGAVRLYELEDGGLSLEKGVPFKELTTTAYVQRPCRSFSGIAGAGGMATVVERYTEKTYR